LFSRDENLKKVGCGGFCSFLNHSRFKKQTKSVDALTETLLDAGSTPAASMGTGLNKEEIKR